jgi:ATP-dependent DNA ligase
VVYTVVHSKDVTTCNCPGWANRRSCKHVDEVLGKAPKAKLTPVPKTAQLPFIVGDIPVQTMQASALPEGNTLKTYAHPGWVLEEKYDGHRMVVQISEDRSAMAWSRAGNVRSLPVHVQKALAAVAPGVYDGELLIPGGTSTDVTALALSNRMELVLFDILRVGRVQSTLHLTLSERRALLEVALSKADVPVRISSQVPVSERALQRIWDRGGEGAILKSVLSKYLPGKRSPEWIKFKKLGAAKVTITGYEEGLLGPYSKVKGVDHNGVEVSVKALNDEWRAQFAADPDRYIGMVMVISYQEQTKTGKYRHPMADHLLETR